jgi:hypothetical protein
MGVSRRGLRTLGAPLLTWDASLARAPGHGARIVVI